MQALSSSTSVPRSSTRRWIIFGLLAVVVLLGICAGVIFFGGSRLFQTAQRATAEATAVVDQFMRAGATNDSAAAFALFGQTARTQNVTQEQIADLFTTRRDVFQDYQETQAGGWRIQTTPQGTQALLAGTMQAGGQSRRFAATLANENGQWKLVNIEFPEGVGR